MSFSYLRSTMSRGALPGRKPGSAACFWKSLVMESKASSTFCDSTSTRTSFLQGAKFSTVTFTTDLSMNRRRHGTPRLIEFPPFQRAEKGRYPALPRQARRRVGGTHLIKRGGSRCERFGAVARREEGEYGNAIFD